MMMFKSLIYYKQTSLKTNIVNGIIFIKLSSYLNHLLKQTQKKNLVIVQQELGFRDKNEA